MKKLNLAFLLAIGLLFSSQSFAASTTWTEGDSVAALQVGAATTAIGTSLAIGDTAYGIDFVLSQGESRSYYFDTLQALTIGISTQASGLNLDWDAFLYNVGDLTSPLTGLANIGALSNDIVEYLPTVGSFVYTIVNNSSSDINFSVTSVIASTPIPAALLLFGTAFAGLFGVKSYNSKKMAA